MNTLSHLEPESRGCVHIYAGDGKGKTTAAVGLSVRACGHGKRVLFCQFLKSRPTGELAPMERLGIPILRADGSAKFVFQMSDAEKEAEGAVQRACLDKAVAEAMAGAVDLLVLDEVLDAVNLDIIPQETLVRFLEARPGHLEVVMTGRNPKEALCRLADYHTNFACVAHPYQKGVRARAGVEY